MSRPARIALAAVALIGFLAISALVARALNAGSAERDAIVEAVRVQARSLRRPGEVDVLRVDPSTRFALGPATEVSRVAWKAGRALPVVQCVTLRRTGSLLEGFSVRVVRVSPPIPREGAC